MHLFFRAALIFASFSIFGFGSKVDEQSSFWIIQEDFVKFGKKDLYESQKQLWLKGFNESLASRSIWRQKRAQFPIIGMQGMDQPQYIYLTPLESKEEVVDFFLKKDRYERALSNEKNQLNHVLDSSMNFSVDSLHLYLKDLAHPQSMDAASWYNYPFYQYWVFGIMPGYDDDFEAHLKKVLGNLQSVSDACCRVWKVVLGADTPKYVVLVGAKEESILEKSVSSLSFIEGPIKDITRNQREGRAILKENLTSINR